MSFGLILKITLNTVIKQSFFLQLMSNPKKYTKILYLRN